MLTEVSDFVLDTVRCFYDGGDEVVLAARYAFPFPVLAPSFETTIPDADQFIRDADRFREFLSGLGIDKVVPELISTVFVSDDTAAVQIRRARLRADGSEQGADFSVYTAVWISDGWVLTSLSISDRAWPSDCNSFDPFLHQRALRRADSQPVGGRER